MGQPMGHNLVVAYVMGHVTSDLFWLIVPDNGFLFAGATSEYSDSDNDEIAPQARPMSPGPQAGPVTDPDFMNALRGLEKFFASDEALGPEIHSGYANILDPTLRRKPVEESVTNLALWI